MDVSHGASNLPELLSPLVQQRSSANSDPDERINLVGRDRTDLKSVAGFTNKQRAYLIKAGFTNTAEVLFTPLSALSERFKLSQSESKEFIDVIVKDRASYNDKGGLFQAKTVAERLGLVPDESPRKLICKRSVLSTGDEGLDTLLNGGVRIGALTEIAGEASSGKTALSLQLSLRVQLPFIAGGLFGSCAYLSSEGNFPSSRLVDIASTLKKGNYPTLQGFTDNVHLIHCSEVETLLHAVRYSLPALVEKLEQRWSARETEYDSNRDNPEHDNDFEEAHLTFKSPDFKPVKLVIVDSIAAPFRGSESSYADSSTSTKPSISHHLTERTRDLVEIASSLYRLAQRHDLAVVLVNQVSDVFSVTDRSLSSSNKANSAIAEMDTVPDDDQGLPLEYRHYAHASRFFSGQDAGSGGKMAVFGLAWTNCLNMRIMLSRTGRRRRIADGTAVTWGVGTDADGAEINEQDLGAEEVRRADVVFGSFGERGGVEYVLRQQGLVAIGQVELQPRLGVIKKTVENAKVNIHEHCEKKEVDEDEEDALWQTYNREMPLEGYDLVQEGVIEATA